jgi:DNA-binding NarL/FixJ family response regulator
VEENNLRDVEHDARIDLPITEDEEVRNEMDRKIFLKQFVSRYYQMDPETEDLIPNAGGLRNGMRVLAEDDDRRISLDVIGNGNPSYEANALRWNRWLVVSDLEIYKESGFQVVSFVANYDDGTKRLIRQGYREAWYVKRDSIPEEPVILTAFDSPEMAERIEKLREEFPGLKIEVYKTYINTTSESRVQKATQWMKLRASRMLRAHQMNQEGKTNREIAEFMGVDENHVRNLLKFKPTEADVDLVNGKFSVSTKQECDDLVGDSGHSLGNGIGNPKEWVGR